MGCGKTTFGKKFATFLNWKFIDLDQYIEEKQSKTVAQIFKDGGEKSFRQLERLALDLLLNNEEKLIISLGGGTVCYSDIASKLDDLRSVIVCYLKYSPTVIIGRLENEIHTRPLLNEVENLEVFIRGHLEERERYYEMADLIIEDEENSNEITRQIKGYIDYLNASTT